MHPGRKKIGGAALIAPALWLVTLLPGRSLGDEPSLLGRLFRFGGGAPASAPAPAPGAPGPNDVGAGLPNPPAGALPYSLSPPSTPPAAAGPAPRITPRPRVSRPVTEADPLVTRVWLLQSNDGAHFGMFMQVFADGTVIDNTGAHHLGREALKPLLDVLQSSDLYRVKGHCGSPATDFVEQVHVVVYERSLGRLRAHAFSHSGNMQGCDHVINHLNAALEALQTRLNPPITSPAPGPMPTAPAVNGVPGAPPAGTTIPLTPSD